MYLIAAMMQKEIMQKEEKGGPIISYRYLLVVLPIIQVMSLYT